MLRKVLIGAVFLVATFAAPAAAQYVDVVVTPGEVAPGGTVTVSGQGCPPGSTVTVTLVPGDVSGAIPSPLPAGSIEVGTTTADGDGNFTLEFTVPADAEPGTYTVVTSCDGIVRGETIVVAATDAVPPGTTPGGTPGTTPASSGGGGSLPRTGSDVDRIGLIGAGLVAAGGAVALTARKRRSTGSAAA
ncbi:MAG TPA: LPXTG cell wall anchor domain-containing protein [Aquihabitans sp.]|jgi:LPXTG-motif cell wall-anchored protein|nr:LPXTG cell wall anchor domain-containing protein [Aquihabitans sp.]